MPKAHFDWFTVSTLWLGAAIMAIKAGGLPLIDGAPVWLASRWWNYVPVALVTIYLSVALYRMLSPRQTRLAKGGPSGTSDTKHVHRRQLIADGRKLIAAFNRQTRHEHLMDFLRRQDEWHAIRAHLDPKVRRDMENERLSVGTRDNVKDGKVYYLVEELDRLEREWELA